MMNELLEGQVALDPRLDFIAGTISGMAGLLVGHPFDTLKVRFQNPQTAQKYASMMNAVSTIIHEEKFVGLYKGITSPLASVALMNGLVFSSYRFLLKLQMDHSDAIPTLSQIALAGAGCGIISSVITTPVELIKIRQQSSLTRTSTFQVAHQIFKEAGISGLYRGLAVTALRDVGYGAYFFAYEATCRLLAPQIIRDNPLLGGMTPWPVLLIAGGVAGIFGWAATFPLDVVKTRMQSTTLIARNHTSPLLSTTTNPYQTMLSTIVHSYRTEGIGVFFRGLAPTLIRAIPVNMVTFATFEAIVHSFS